METQDDKQRCAFCGGRVDASGKPLPEDDPPQGAVELCFTCGRLFSKPAVAAAAAENQPAVYAVDA